MQIGIKVGSNISKSLRLEQLRQLAKCDDGILRDVNQGKIVMKVVTWFLEQTPEVKDSIVGDLFEHRRIVEA